MKFLPCIFLVTLPFAMSTVCAADFSDGPVITISGFGSAALTRSNTDDAEFARPNQYAGVKSTAKTGPDSNFGIQATAKMNDWLSFTAQGLVRKNVTDEFGGELAWAFAKFKVSDNLNVRIGRVGLPVYMISDYRNVGYANYMLRPPVEMYAQVPLESVDGIDAVYQTSFGDSTVTAQFAVGESKVDSKSGYKIEAKSITAINLIVENGPFTARFGRTDAKLSLLGATSLNSLLDALNKYGFSPQANQLSVVDKKASFTSLGLGVDWNNFVVQTEYGKRKSESLSVPDTSSWYTMFGYRFGKFMPYVNHASVSQNSPRSVAGLPTTGPLAGLAAGANDASSTALQTSNSVGMRWDFNKSAALKLQLDRFAPESGSGTFLRATPAFKGPVTVIAAAVDFVF